MSESISFTKGADKNIIYKEIIPQIEALIQDEQDLIANLANVAAILRDSLDFFWVGFYLVRQDQLVLGPFQGSLACTRISKGKGVCGKAWERGETILVPDVEKFEGHIACSSLSRSEIVVPMTYHNEIMGVLDVDSDRLNSFDTTDAICLEKICTLLAEKFLYLEKPS